MERALKSNFLTKSTPQQFLFEDLFYVNGVTGAGVSCDDFSVDTFLDLPNDDDDFGNGCLVGEELLAKENSSSSNFSGDFDSGSSFPAGDLSVPVEDIDQLEWLSQFVDDSPSELSLLCPPAGKGKTVTASKTITFVPVNRQPPPPPPPPAPAQISPLLQSPPSVPTKPRSKRSRPNGQAWSKALQLIQEWAASSNVKRQRKCLAGDGGGTQLPPRQCSHCHVQKTPQWRSGPLGEKTLCNACGVRYKSGRLFPEYRPASSPTFLENVHSNSHRKVLEMRMKKEVTGPGSGVGVGAMNSMMVPNLEMQFNGVTSF